jgi:hypothetical protein
VGIERIETPKAPLGLTEHKRTVEWDAEMRLARGRFRVAGATTRSGQIDWVIVLRPLVTR